MEGFEDIKIGFIGFGNMGQSIARGILKAKAVEPDAIYVCAKDWEKLKANAEALGVNACAEAAEVAKAADIVFIAVKPYLASAVCSPIAEILADGKAVVSVAAGMTFDVYEEFLAPGTNHISTIPNTPVSVCEGVWTCEKRHSLTDEQFAAVMTLLDATGLVAMVETKLLGIAGTITGCGPAFVDLFMEALGDAGVKHGLPRKLAYALASQMIAGAGKMAADTGEHPGILKDAVCSPGGTTIKGVASLERSGLRAAVIDAIDAIEG